MFKNKRFLITQPAIRSINGSTVVTLELANQLLSMGAKVTVYTCDFAEPAKSYFESSNIKVDIAENEPKYKLTDFDYIWVHSQILPISIIDELTKKIPNNPPAFIFLHMSGMDWIPDEKPWIYNLENHLSSLSLFITEEVKKVNKSFLSSNIPTEFFRNPAPNEFTIRQHKPSKTLKDLLIVSSHPPKEVLEAKKILSDVYHINTTILGEDQEEYRLFTKKLLEQYDAVLTIAKTVPYCLISGTPVYIYDIYGGGPGWLNQDNFEPAKTRNFSGYQNAEYPNYEGGVFHRKTANQIVREVINGYNDSLSFHEDNQKSFLDDFMLQSVLEKLFGNIHVRKINPLPQDYANVIILAQKIATSRFIEGGKLYERDGIIRNLKKDNKLLSQKIKDLETYRQEAEKVFSSKAYQLFDKTITPYKKIKERSKHHD